MIGVAICLLISLIAVCIAIALFINDRRVTNAIDAVTMTPEQRKRREIALWNEAVEAKNRLKKGRS